jgi:hypothetical protein
LGIIYIYWAPIFCVLFQHVEIFPVFRKKITNRTPLRGLVNEPS